MYVCTYICVYVCISVYLFVSVFVCICIQHVSVCRSMFPSVMFQLQHLQHMALFATSLVRATFGLFSDRAIALLKKLYFLWGSLQKSPIFCRTHLCKEPLQTVVNFKSRKNPIRSNTKTNSFVQKGFLKKSSKFICTTKFLILKTSRIKNLQITT